METDGLLGPFWDGVIAAIGAFTFLFIVWRIVRSQFTGDWWWRY